MFVVNYWTASVAYYRLRSQGQDRKVDYRKDGQISIKLTQDYHWEQ